MARYVTLLRFTDQGAKNMKNSPTRALAFTKAAENRPVGVSPCDPRCDWHKSL